ncbi:hypothetical protein [Pseudomonas sp. GM30]|uniref:hypothetical protein n=1 Tax=Pseudomonas sp. GM30 TaxID=1144328 RepID=UPI001EE6575A|nr:hypothetical protein [Pseudomonas sp. GM30]
MEAREFSHFQSSDITGNGQSTQVMGAISREEFNARIETIETRMDARLDAVSMKIDGFLSVQGERDKTQVERDKRYDLITQEMRRIADGAQDAARQGATVKANVWAATAVQLLGIVAIVVGAYYANQANMYVAIQTTFAAVQAGKDAHTPKSPELPTPLPPQ